MEHGLQPWIAFFILPVFAFSNAGVNLTGVSISDFLNPVTLGIALGLFFGNQFGIFSACWIAVKLGLAKLPEGATWQQLYGVGCLCGIGFTMSLFIGGLAFSGATPAFDERIGIIAGSLVSGIIGYLVLRRSLAGETASE